MTPHFFCLLWLLLSRISTDWWRGDMCRLFTPVYMQTSENAVVLMLFCFWSVARESTNVSWPQRISLGKQRDSGVGTSGSPWSCPQGTQGSIVIWGSRSPHQTCGAERSPTTRNKHGCRPSQGHHGILKLTLLRMHYCLDERVILVFFFGL